MGERPNMAVELAGMRMKNPVLLASGTCGLRAGVRGPDRFECAGRDHGEGDSEPWSGNNTPRLVETPGGLLNAIGLQNPGVDGFVREYLPFLRRFDVPVIVNIWGRTVEEYAEVAARFDGVPGVHALELNISCPNIKAGGMEFGTDPVTAARVIALVRSRTGLPLIPKLAPNVPNIALFARIAEENGADAISLINSVPGMVIDVETRRPVLANGVGGVTGPAIRPIAVRLVWQAARAVKIPVIGMGGIATGRDALEFLIAGASAVAVGGDVPRSGHGTARGGGDREYLVRHGMSDVRELVGESGVQEVVPHEAKRRLDGPSARAVCRVRGVAHPVVSVRCRPPARRDPAASRLCQRACAVGGALDGLGRASAGAQRAACVWRQGRGAGCVGARCGDAGAGAAPGAAADGDGLR